MRSWRSCSHSVLVLKPRSDPIKDKLNHFIQSRNSLPGCDDIAPSCVSHPNIICGEDLHGTTTALIPVFASQAKNFAVYAPCCPQAKDNMLKQIQFNFGETFSQPCYNASDSRDEGYTT